ncbi:EAL domain-containing protein [Pseudothauera hydrothermalis]|uniref:bifunctional diguanylate cyclase/phosphodiesterase n=1 Tax=Pseudothauera hydrothermalis TaxID=2184083 RepID=UPI000E096293|nr:EAL domain-containing protein [Pseudothauera hydrothermalis]
MDTRSGLPRPTPHTAHLQRRIGLFAIAGILVTSLLTGLATALPLYLDARKQIENSVGYDIRSRAEAAGQLLAHFRSVAMQVTSRTQLREALERYNRSALSLPELQRFSVPRLRDALAQSPEIVGMVRLDADGQAVVQLGQTIAPQHWPQPPEGRDIVLYGPVEIGAEPVLVVGAPIRSAEGARVGYDIIAFRLTDLSRLIADAQTYGRHTHYYLINLSNGHLLQFAGSAQRLQPAASDDPLHALIGPHLPAPAVAVPLDAATDRIAFVQPLPQAPAWALAMSTERTGLFSPALGKLALPAGTVLILVLVGTVLTSRAIRPLSERIVRQAEQLTLAASVFESGQEGILIMDESHRIVQANRAARQMTGTDPQPLSGRKLCEALCSPEHSDFCEHIWQSAQQHGRWQGEARFLHSRDGYFPAWLSLTAVRDSDGAVLRYIAMFTDISERKQAEARIRQLAHYDGLTGLPNRALLHDRLAHALERARRRHEQVAVLFVDLDRFKNVNDSLGHAVGDELLRAVAGRMEAVLREQDTVARLGGDEFLIVLESLDGPAAAEQVARKVLEALQTPFHLGDHELFIGASIGIALYPNDGQDVSMLVQNADTAMYRAKDCGRNTFQFYTAELAQASRERFELEAGLRRAIERNEFFLEYQPQVDCANGRIIGVEALLRWAHPHLGRIAPDKFIALAEETGLIVPIGRWVLRTACQQAMRWYAAGRALQVAINVSGRQITHDDIVAAVRDALAASGLPPAWLELEITEGQMLHDVAQTTRVLEALRALGVTLAIDDFGTGYSSLSYLKRLPLNRLKIDRSFVSGLPDDRDDLSIVATILAMARNLGLEVVAEGVETAAQLHYLREHGCNAYQGWLCAPAMDADALQTLLDTQAASV